MKSSKLAAETSPASSIRQTGLEDECFTTSSLDEGTIPIPNTEEETEKLGEILEQEMAGLSLEERDKLLFEIHGFSEREEESEDRMSQLLATMDHALYKTSNDREAFLLAKNVNKAYVMDRDFRLMFLRSEQYNVKQAAERMAMHFTIKKELFGSGEILGRDVQLSDLSEDDLETLRSGFLQVFPSSDVAGRTIISFAPSHRVCKNLDNVARTYWYMFMTCLRGDDEMQKRGFVLVSYTDGVFPDGVTGEIWFLRRLFLTRQGVPKKLAAVHNCGMDPSLRPIEFWLRQFVPKELKKRIRPHYGSYAETIFEAQTFGIKAEDHPMGIDGSLSLEWHHEWLQMQKSREEADSAACSALVPRRFDVLFGRSRLTRTHTGNLRAAHLVDMHQEEYEQGDKSGKTRTAERVLGIINESGGRFLKWEDKGWVEVGRDVARNKISHFFRLNRSKKKDEKVGESNCSSKRLTAELGMSTAGDDEKAAKRVHDHKFNTAGVTRRT